MNILANYTGEKRFVAKNGASGGGKSREGLRGEDYTIDVPVGSKITDQDRNRIHTLDHEGQTIKILHGGRGGLGNEHFKSSTNRSPEEATKGTRGERGTFFIEVALIADVGLIGLPNAGKSTLLNALTNATSAVNSYPFTTLEPHLGVFHEYVLADIPGLIEGAGEGKGLGYKFLRHVGRTRMLLHCISLETSTSDETPTHAYEVVREELKKFDPTFLQKEEWVVLTKSDLVSLEYVEHVRHAFRVFTDHVYVISVPEDGGVAALGSALSRRLTTTGVPSVGE